MQIILTDEFKKAGLARAVPGAYFRKPHWLVDDPDPRTASIILRLFPSLAQTYPDLLPLQTDRAEAVRPYDAAAEYNVRISAPRVEQVLKAEGHKLYNFQAVDLGYVAARLQEHGGAYIGWDRGLGKTLATATLIDALEATAVLVISPNSAKETVWLAELTRFLPWMKIIVLRNSARKRSYDLEYVEECKRKKIPFVLIVHYEALALIAGRAKTKTGKITIADGWQRYGEWDLVAADEAHRLKNTKTKQAKAAKKIPAKARIALSGSIVENHAEELFSQLQFILPKTYSSKWRDWNSKYLDYFEGPYGRICLGIKDARANEMRTELGTVMVYRRKEDALDLPDKTEQTHLLELSLEQRKVYDQLCTELLASLPDGQRIKADEGLSLLTKLRQIATGLNLDGEISDSTKLDYATDLIVGDEDSVFVVFSWYKAPCYALARRLESSGIQSFVVTGDVPSAERSDYIDAFQAPANLRHKHPERATRAESALRKYGNRRVFIGTISTLGESVNLFRANNAVFLDRAWNPALNAQAEDRLHRHGQKNAVTITHLVAKDTVDQLRVMPVLETKAALRSMILGAK